MVVDNKTFEAKRKANTWIRLLQKSLDKDKSLDRIIEALGNEHEVNKLVIEELINYKNGNGGL